MDDGAVVAAAGVAAPVRPARVKYTAKVARAICDRVAGGETVTAICREDGMPNRGTVTAWSKKARAFRERLDRARTLGGWDPEDCRRRDSYCEVTGREIFGRLCAGESMTSICADPAMPSQGTVARWREARPELDARLELARKVQAERFCDLGWDIASKVTPGDAYATHVKLLQLRWTAGAMDPGRYGRFKPVEASVTAPARAPTEVVFRARNFQVVVGPDGQKRVVEIEELSEAEARDQGPWRRERGPSGQLLP